VISERNIDDARVAELLQRCLDEQCERRPGLPSLTAESETRESRERADEFRIDHNHASTGRTRSISSGCRADAVSVLIAPSAGIEREGESRREAPESGSIA